MSAVEPEVASISQISHTNHAPMSVHITLVENRIKKVLLDITEPCPSLHNHLVNSSQSLDWLSENGASALLKLAVSLDDIFDRNLLSLIFRD